ncbi:hypothetical protein B9Z65_3927 [Elsinoe australis]|uniref:Uncharacterized protein n=1 Tax=Elsinoe australis TaxID=40998 RepID=A0A2P8A313_9PEZI|nr:hypothetical protein B9Z65_3927 [Elsinoe australis]
MATNLKYINKLEGSLVLIFGATSGFGFAVAEGALEHGATVVLSGSKQERLDLARPRLLQSFPSPISKDRISIAVCDLADLETLDRRLEALMAQITDTGKRTIDHIVFTADDAYAGSQYYRHNTR